MGRIIICNRTDCKYNACKSCECDIVELDIDGTCMFFEEIDIYKEVPSPYLSIFSLNRSSQAYI